MRVARPVIAVSTAAVLILIEAVVDPTGLLVLVGWPGGMPRVDLWWPIARYVVFVPVMLAVIWWGALRTGGRFWTMSATGVLAVLLAQAATVLAMTGDPLLAGWAAGYVTAKAVPAALIIAGATRLASRSQPAPVVDARRGSWPAAVVFAAAACLVGGQWWTSSAYAPTLPAPRGDAGLLMATIGLVLLSAGAWAGMRWTHRRVPGFLGTWLGAMVGAGLFGMAQAIIALFLDDGFRGDFAPLLAAYIHIADGLSFGAAAGWVAGLVVLLTERVTARAEGRMRPAARVMSLAASLVVLLVAGLVGGLLHAPAQRAEAEAPTGFLRIEGDAITDGAGNQILLRGANVNQLVDFYQPRAEVAATRPLTEEDYEGMAALGFNTVRLGLSWSALEPTEGELDQDYLAQIHEAVDWGAAHGIRTVLDLHQDGWSNAPTPEGTVCRPGTDPMWGYDGAPEWATRFDDAPRCSFTGRDISPAGDRAFEHFWFDTDGVQTALVHTWGELAGEFADEPAVAGFDLLNEPGFGETAPVTTSHQLGRFWSRTIDAIRAAGAPQIVFLEPSILWSGLGIDSGPHPDFTDDPNIVFSPHLYAESITMDHSLELPTIVSIERQFEYAQRVTDDLDSVLWSGEYGYWGDEDDIAARMSRYATEEDRRMLGSAYWVWKQSCGDPQNGIGPIGLAIVPEDCTTGDDAPPNERLLALLSRAYPQEAPGRLTSLSTPHSGGTEGRLSMTATTQEPGCGLTVWVPGEAEPEVISSEGVTDVERAEVPGGWMLTGCAAGDYSLVVD